mgnify:CR=1 FL=1
MPVVLAAGLPEITGSFTSYPMDISNQTGAFAKSVNGAGKAWQESGSQQGRDTVVFNASDSDATYGNSDTVQPPAIQLIPQIKY